MYLANDTKLWQRTCIQDAINTKESKIETVDPKSELKEQFQPSNSSIVAQDTLAKLKQDGSMMECMKKFRFLMLGVMDMLETYKLYTFLKGLQLWGHFEWRSQGMKDLSITLATKKHCQICILLRLWMNPRRGRTNAKSMNGQQVGTKENKGKVVEGGTKKDSRTCKKFFNFNGSHSAWVCLKKKKSMSTSERTEELD